MANDRDEFGVASVKPDYSPAGSLGPAGGFLPPLDVAVDLPDFRYEKLRGVVAELVVPHLLALHEAARVPAPPQGEPLTEEIAKLAQLVLGPDNDDAANYMMMLKDGGISLDDLHTELLEPAARRLGELWNDDRIDFVDVTLGVGRLQRLVHVFERLDKVPDYDEKRRVLLAAAPGEQHSLGTTIVQKFLRAGGWHVWTCSSPSVDETADITSHEWFAVVGFSLGSDVHLDQLAKAIRNVKKRSINPQISVMIGGSAVSRDPGIVEFVGADGTAANGPAAVVLAKKLLAKTLT